MCDCMFLLDMTLEECIDLFLGMITLCLVLCVIYLYAIKGEK